MYTIHIPQTPYMVNCGVVQFAVLSCSNEAVDVKFTIKDMATGLDVFVNILVTMHNEHHNLNEICLTCG